jgi:hypothetical protein
MGKFLFKHYANKYYFSILKKEVTMKLFLYAVVLFSVMSTSCRAPQMLIKQEAKIDTFNLAFDFRTVQPYEYRQMLEQRLEKFVSVYNGETHPFKLSLNSGDTLQSCTIKVTRSKFVSKKQSNLHLGYSVLGLGTFGYLLATGFPVPVGWVFIPRARTTMEPTLSNDISDMEGRASVGIISSGMYRSQQKQMEIQSTKFLKYIVSIVQTVEAEYEKKKQ